MDSQEIINKIYDICTSTELYSVLFGIEEFNVDYKHSFNFSVYKQVTDNDIIIFLDNILKMILEKNEYEYSISDKPGILFNNKLYPNTFITDKQYKINENTKLNDFENNLEDITVYTKEDIIHVTWHIPIYKT
jgi:hypothetical protein